jgi:hypothetical protein
MASSPSEGSWEHVGVWVSSEHFFPSSGSVVGMGGAGSFLGHLE